MPLIYISQVFIILYTDFKTYSCASTQRLIVQQAVHCLNKLKLAGKIIVQVNGNVRLVWY